MEIAPHTSKTADADVGALGRWLLSWVQENGAVHGFHNHSIWGGNPYRTQDFTSGHTTFASPLIMGLLNLLQRQPDERARLLLQKLVRFQIGALQPDGEYAHIGFQCGEMLKWGLIHNAVPNVALSYALVHGRDQLGEELAEAVQMRVASSLEVLDRLYPNESLAEACINQEYARTWARLLLAQASGDESRMARGLDELDRIVAAAHRFGFPDRESAGALRSPKDEDYLEPAEYYGLHIAPLILAYSATKRDRYLEAAISFARHIVRSSWVDSSGCRRLHRTWHRINGQWHYIRRPMCISGSGLSCYAIAQLQKIAPDGEYAEFLRGLRSTYAFYQHPAGFFQAGADWNNELDVVPSTAWHSHDFLFLSDLVPAGGSPWDQILAPSEGKVDILLGRGCFYAEDGVHWAIEDYATTDTFRLRGRKDRDRFFREHFNWIKTAPKMPDEFIFGRLPRFVLTDEGAALLSGTASALRTKAVPGLSIKPG